MTHQSIWLLCVALCVLGSIWVRPRPAFAIMASAGLLALAFPGTAFGKVAFLVSVIAASADMTLMLLSALRSLKR